MRRVSYPADIMAAARGLVSALTSAGIEISQEDHAKAADIIAAAFNAERTSIQNDVVAAVVNESEACRAAVFKALRRVGGQ